MQRVIFQQVTPIQFQSQATRVLPGHGTGLKNQAVNDDTCLDDNSPLKMVLSVLANVIGGALLLSGMLFFPHLLSQFLR